LTRLSVLGRNSDEYRNQEELLIPRVPLYVLEEFRAIDELDHLARFWGFCNAAGRVQGRPQ